jgi:uncharacterized protein YajQ (UPF0234 family)
MLQSKASKRGISLKAFEYGKVEPASHRAVRQVIAIKSGIPKDKSKPLLEAIKTAKLKVNAQLQDEKLRVTGKSKDDLQAVQALLSGLDFELPLQFTNYR